MAITIARIVRDINHIRAKTPLKFKNFGAFFLKLMLMSVEDQEYIVDSLKSIASHAKEENGFVITDVVRPSVALKGNETKYRFIVEHDFICKLCKRVNSEGTNACVGKLREVCEYCMDKAEDYVSDSVANQLYD